MNTIVAKIAATAALLPMAATPAHAASCYSYKIPKPFTGHSIAQEIKRSGKQVNHVIRIIVPPLERAQLTPAFSKYYVPTATFRELYSKPVDNSKSATYQLSFQLKLGRQNSKNLPGWAKPVKDQPFRRCTLYANGTRLLVDKKVYGSSPKCVFTINAQTHPVIKNSNFIEARAYDYDNILMYRGRYSMHYPAHIIQERSAIARMIRSQYSSGQCTAK